MPSSIRVAVCDNSPALRHGLKVLLKMDTSISTEFEVSSHGEMLAQHSESPVDIVIADIDNSNADDLENLRKFKALRPDVKMVMFSSCTDKNLIMQLLELGVQGFHPKHAPVDDIIKAIHTVHRGGSSLAPCTTAILLDHMATKSEPAVCNLSDREEEVMQLVAKGKSNSYIASKLYISVRTVKFHVSSIFGKLNVSNRTEAAALWTH